MALGPVAEFGSRATAADSAYPLGSSKNETSPGANDGTPYNKRRADDLFGFQQALLDSASVTANDQPDSVDNPQYLQSLYRIQQRKNLILNGGMWFSQEFGSAVSVAAASSFAGANYLIDNYLANGDGGSNPITATWGGLITPDGRRSNELVLNGNQSDNTDLFFHTLVEELVGGQTVTFSCHMNNNTGAPVITPLLSVEIMDGTRATIGSPILTDVSLFQDDGTTTTVPADSTVYRMQRTVDMPADLGSTDRYVKITIKLPGRDYTTDTLGLSDFKFEISPFATKYVVENLAEEFLRIQGIYETSYQAGDPVADVNNLAPFAHAVGTDRNIAYIRFRTEKRHPPIISLYSTVTGGGGLIRDDTGAADVAAAGAQVGLDSFRVEKSTASVDGNRYNWHWVADARL